MIETNDWGDTLPNDVITTPPQPVPGSLRADGNIDCRGCYKTVPNNSSPGLLPSCPNCWAAITLD
jgi:hypothetical protein